MKTMPRVYVCSRPDCNVTVDRDALRFCLQATSAGLEGYNPPICKSHIHDSLKRVKLDRISDSKKKGRANEEAKRNKGAAENSGITEEEASLLLTLTEAARIFRVSPEGISTLISFDLISEEVGRKVGTVYVSKESCASFATLLTTGEIVIAELTMLNESDRQRLAQNLGKIFVSLQNGAFS
ncbi:hypothetical protein K0A96_00435 [Patescibacteria group bacterium]|nr:hypothetical protein [Patescibacteria group bacterium]